MNREAELRTGLCSSVRYSRISTNRIGVFNALHTAPGSMCAAWTSHGHDEVRLGSGHADKHRRRCAIVEFEGHNIIPRCRSCPEPNHDARRRDAGDGRVDQERRRSCSERLSCRIFGRLNPDVSHGLFTLDKSVGIGIVFRAHDRHPRKRQPVAIPEAA